MSDHEKAAVLLRLMDMQYTKYRQSRDIEFKVNIAIWTALLLASKILLEKGFNICDCTNGLTYLLVSVLIVIFHQFFWLKPIQSTQNRDSNFIENCRKELEKLNVPKIKYSKLRQRWIAFELIFTAGILLGNALLLAARL